MKEGLYTTNKDYIISEEQLKELSNQEIMDLLSSSFIDETNHLALYNVYMISKVECYALVIVSKMDDRTYQIYPIGMDNVFDITFGDCLFQLYREDFEDDLVIGLDESYHLDVFEWDFVPEREEDYEVLKEHFMSSQTMEEFKELYDEMREVEIWNESFKPILDDEEYEED